MAAEPTKPTEPFLKTESKRPTWRHTVTMLSIETGAHTIDAIYQETGIGKTCNRPNLWSITYSTVVRTYIPRNVCPMEQSTMNQPTRYVAGLLFGNIHSRMPTNVEVLLIRKSHPNWMKGKLNGIGGHIEPGELADYAMCREFAEETGLDPIDVGNWHWKHFATISGTETGPAKEPWVVYWYTAAIRESRNYPSFETSAISNPLRDEPVAWFDIESITRGLHGNMMPNLCWLIYMAKARIEGIDRALNFRIEEGYSAEYSLQETTQNEKELLKQFDTKCPMCHQRHYMIIHQCRCGHTY